MDKYKVKRIFFILLVVVLSALASGCQSGNETETRQADKIENVRVLITSDFGKAILKDEELKYNANYSVLDYLENISEVETAYGGGFVNGIDGLRSGFTNQKNKVKKDWFFYANGIFSHLGALDYYPSPGEIVQWDYHLWEKSSSSSTLLSGFTEVFHSGYDGHKAHTTILYSEGFKDLGQTLSEFLTSQGLEFEVEEYTGKDDITQEGHTILICPSEEMLSSEYILPLLKTYKDRGLFIGVEDGQLMAFNEDYTRVSVIDDEAFMYASQKVYAQSDTLFVLSGKEKAKVTELLHTIIGDSNILTGKTSILLKDDTVIALPLKEG